MLYEYYVLLLHLNHETADGVFLWLCTGHVGVTYHSLLPYLTGRWTWKTVTFALFSCLFFMFSVSLSESLEPD